MGIFAFKAHVNLNEPPFCDKTYGVISATSLADAANKIDREFGKDLMKVSIEPWEENDMLLMSKIAFEYLSSEAGTP